jgi:hypothetical protein
MLIGHVPNILYGVEMVLSHWKTNVVLFSYRFIEFSLDRAKTGMDQL